MAGGAIRDLHLGLPPKDIDIFTDFRSSKNGFLEVLKRELRHIYPTIRKPAKKEEEPAIVSAGDYVDPSNIPLLPPAPKEVLSHVVNIHVDAGYTIQVIQVNGFKRPVSGYDLRGIPEYEVTDPHSMYYDPNYVPTPPTYLHKAFAEWVVQQFDYNVCKAAAYFRDKDMLKNTYEVLVTKEFEKDIANKTLTLNDKKSNLSPKGLARLESLSAKFPGFTLVENPPVVKEVKPKTYKKVKLSDVTIDASATSSNAMNDIYIRAARQYMINAVGQWVPQPDGGLAYRNVVEAAAPAPDPQNAPRAPQAIVDELAAVPRPRRNG